LFEKKCRKERSPSNEDVSGLGGKRDVTKTNVKQGVIEIKLSENGTRKQGSSKRKTSDQRISKKGKKARVGGKRDTRKKN